MVELSWSWYVPAGNLSLLFAVLFVCAYRRRWRWTDAAQAVASLAWFAFAVYDVHSLFTSSPNQPRMESELTRFLTPLLMVSITALTSLAFAFVLLRDQNVNRPLLAKRS